MPEETENTQIEAAVELFTEGVISPDEAAEIVEADGDDAPEADKPKPEEPFDRKIAEARIKKANTEAKNLRDRLKKAEAAEAELQKLKDAEKSDTERLTDQLAAANERIDKTRKRLVKSQVQALAAASFADPEDPISELDLDSYIDSDGDIDEAAIEADLQALLERKPHWAKSLPPEGPRRPAPDRTQASGANKSRPLAPADEFAGWLTSQLK